MARTRLVIIGIALAFTFACVPGGRLPAAEFSAEATALPFPPDAKDVEFAPRFGDIKYTSASLLKSLAAFYLKEMPARGWQHDEAAAVIEDETIKLTFKHEAALVKVELKQWSKEVHISLDCEKLQFTGTDDPVKLVAAGVPVPKALLKLQKDFPLPAGAVDLRYTGSGCMFKSPLKLDEAFDHFTKLAPGKGFRESRRPIVTATRKYTEFKSGTAEFSVNVFTDAVGSRIILEYKDAAKETPVPPLAAVASLPIKGGGSDKPASGAAATTPAAAAPIDVAGNKGSATINYAGKQYTFANVACYQTKSRGKDNTMVVFSAKPIPVNKMQSLIATKDDFSFGDLYEFSSPEHLVLQLSENASFSFALSNLSVGHPVEKAVNEMKLEAGRVKGTLKMPTIMVFSDESLAFTATADAVVITPTTRITGPGDPVVKSDNPILAEAPIPFPGEVQNAGSEGSKYRKKYTALVSTPLAEVAAFYGKELPAKGWTRTDVESAASAMQFKNDKMELSLSWKQERGKTAIEALARNIALAKQEGVFPEPGKGRLVLGNGSDVAVVFTIGTTNYPLKPGQGGKDQKDALNYSLAPGKYTVLLKVPGQPQETEKIEITAGTTWGLIALPGGGCFPVQLF